MKTSVAQIIAKLLSQDSSSPLTAVSSAAAWPVYVAEMPQSPDNMAVVYDTSGVRLPRLFDGTEQYRHGIQVRVRGLTYDVAWAKMNEVIYALMVTHKTVVQIDSGSFYTIDSIAKTGTPLSLGQDERRRASLTINCLVMFNKET